MFADNKELCICMYMQIRMFEFIFAYQNYNILIYVCVL